MRNSYSPTESTPKSNIKQYEHKVKKMDFYCHAPNTFIKAIKSEFINGKWVGLFPRSSVFFQSSYMYTIEELSAYIQINDESQLNSFKSKIEVKAIAIWS